MNKPVNSEIARNGSIFKTVQNRDDQTNDRIPIATPFALCPCAVPLRGAPALCPCAARLQPCREQPAKTWLVNRGWVVAANISDLAVWTRLLGCHDNSDLREADQDTPRNWHIPDRRACERVLRI
jgi:hypothetical protein